MTKGKLNIGIILGSTRVGRVSPQVGHWVKGIAEKRGDANYEVVDIADYNLPFLGTTDGADPGIAHGMKKLPTWMDSYSSFKNTITALQVP